MENSDYLNLKLPDGSETGDFYNINDFNENFEAIDEEAKRLADGNKRAATGSKLSDLVTPGEYPIANVKIFEDAPSETLQNVDSRLQVSAINGKIYQELTQDQLHFSRTVTGSVASAWYCPELNVQDLQSKMSVVKAYVDRSPSEVQSRLGFMRADNLIKNSTFDNDNFWSPYGSHTMAPVDGKLQLGSPYAGNVAAASGDIDSEAQIGDIIYTAITFESNRQIVGAHFGGTPTTVPAGQPTRISQYYTVAHAAVTRIYAVAEYASPSIAYESTTLLSKPVVINLTKAFGAGFEPSKEEMDRFVGYYQEGFYQKRPSYLAGFDVLNDYIADTVFDLAATEAELATVKNEVAANTANLGLLKFPLYYRGYIADLNAVPTMPSGYYYCSADTLNIGDFSTVGVVLILRRFGGSGHTLIIGQSSQGTLLSKFYTG